MNFFTHIHLSALFLIFTGWTKKFFTGWTKKIFLPEWIRKVALFFKKIKHLVCLLTFWELSSCSKRSFRRSPPAWRSPPSPPLALRFFFGGETRSTLETVLALNGVSKLSALSLLSFRRSATISLEMSCRKAGLVFLSSMVEMNGKKLVMQLWLNEWDINCIPAVFYRWSGAIKNGFAYCLKNGVFFQKG